jgi:quinol monooxygenase YgiN
MSETDAEIAIFANVVAQQGKADEVRAALGELVAATRLEPGNVMYRLHEDPAKPGDFHLFEIYRDQAAVDLHMGSAHFKAAIAKIGTMLAGKPSIVPVKLVAGS